MESLGWSYRLIPLAKHRPHQRLFIRFPPICFHRLLRPFIIEFDNIYFFLFYRDFIDWPWSGDRSDPQEEIMVTSRRYKEGVRASNVADDSSREEGAKSSADGNCRLLFMGVRNSASVRSVQPTIFPSHTSCCN